MGFCVRSTKPGTTYDSAWEVVSEGSGEMVVEYFGCGGWEWVPCLSLHRKISFPLQDVGDEKANLYASTGALTIPKGGKAKIVPTAPNGTPVSLCMCKDGIVSGSQQGAPGKLAGSSRTLR